MKRLSIIIVNWNTRDLLAACLDSIKRYPPDCEYDIWVVDNASSDDSIAMLRQNYPGINLIANIENAGFAKANNQAIRASNGEYVMLLNSDTLVCDGALSALVSFLRQNDSVGVVGAQLLNMDGSRQVSTRHYPTCWSEIITVSGIRQQPIAPEYLYPVEVEAVVGAALMARRDAINQIGGLDENYFMYTEEVDWCFRFHRAGWKIMLIPQAKIMHLNGGSSDPIKERIPFLLTQGRMRFLSLNNPAWVITITKLLIRLLAMLKSWVWRVIGALNPSQRGYALVKSRAQWNIVKWQKWDLPSK